MGNLIATGCLQYTDRFFVPILAEYKDKASSAATKLMWKSLVIVFLRVFDDAVFSVRQWIKYRVSLILKTISEWR